MAEYQRKPETKAEAYARADRAARIGKLVAAHLGPYTAERGE